MNGSLSPLLSVQEPWESFVVSSKQGVPASKGMVRMRAGPTA